MAQWGNSASLTALQTAVSSADTKLTKLDTIELNTRKDTGINIPNYSLYADREKFKVYRRNGFGDELRAVLRDIAVVQHNETTASISTKGINGPYDYHFTLDTATFPNLLANSGITNILLLAWTRNYSSLHDLQKWRMVVLTNRGQIYHNFPSRAVGSDGTELAGDITRFEESAVWDMTGKLYPSNNPVASGVEKYSPGLPSDAYKYFPVANTDPSFVNTYGNGGFGKSIIIGEKEYPRFYEPRRDFVHVKINRGAFNFMGGVEQSDIVPITIIGTYANNLNAQGSRICVFASHDGGRNWFCSYEFASSEKDQNWFNGINTTGIIGGYTADSFIINKRTLTVPTAEIKEPATLFGWGDDVVVSAITKTSPAVVTTVGAHGLSSGNVIAFKNNSANGLTSPDWNWLLNPTASPISGGNGTIFKVKVLTSTTFELYEEFHSAFNNLPCRHIHSINATHDGYILGTGEEYPQGWCLFIRGNSDATDLQFTRLNSSPTGIQRPLGLMLLNDDNIDPTVVFASDSANIARSALQLPEGRTDTITRNSFGVYKGKLSSIDKIDEYKCVLDTAQSAYFFKEKLGSWIFFGRLGLLAISNDKGESWMQDNMGIVQQELFGGVSHNIVVVSQCIIVFK